MAERSRFARFRLVGIFEGFELGNLDGKNGAAVEAVPAEARRDLRESPLQTRIDSLVYAYRILRSHHRAGESIGGKTARQSAAQPSRIRL